MPFDNLEYLSVRNQATNFPKHFHETFCISLIHEGIEQIDLEQQSLYSEAGSISITNPYEIHANPRVDESVRLCFDTIYVSQDLMKFALDGKNITFLQRQIKHPAANQAFRELKRAIQNQENPAIEAQMQRLAEILRHFSQEKEDGYAQMDFKSLSRVNQYIEHNIARKLSLEELAQIANLNKYGFAKKFKRSIGMSPMNYILMRKIFSSKQAITTHAELTQIAYDYDFTDLAHFSNTFKRYVGVSPQAYQRSLPKA